MTPEQLKARRLAQEIERLQIAAEVAPITPASSGQASRHDQQHALVRFFEEHADEIVKLLRTYPEEYTDCELWCLTFNAYSAGTGYGAKRPNATTDDLVDECTRYADAIFPHECKDVHIDKGATECDLPHPSNGSGRQV